MITIISAAVGLALPVSVAIGLLFFPKSLTGKIGEAPSLQVRRTSETVRHVEIEQMLSEASRGEELVERR